MKKEVCVLGVPYVIRFLSPKKWRKCKGLDQEDRKNEDLCGICYGDRRSIFVKTGDDPESTDRVTRHEIIHAFQFESGVWYAMNKLWDVENDTDWLAYQLPKISAVFKELNI